MIPPPEPRAELRRKLRAARRALSSEQRLRASEAACSRLSELESWQSARHIAAYVASDGELDPLPALQAATPGCQIYLPRTLPDRSLRFHRWQPGDPLHAGSMGILEPSSSAPQRDAIDMDLVLMPLVGFDRKGQRLGFGAGCYDRSLADRIHRPAPPILIGLAHALQECEGLMGADWDVPLDLIVTDQEIIHTDNGAH